jgi:hypothetical protein
MIAVGSVVVSSLFFFDIYILLYRVISVKIGFCGEFAVKVALTTAP